MVKRLGLALIAGAALVVAASCNVTTAKLADLKMCKSLADGNVCASDVAVFATTDPEIFASAALKHAPADTKIVVVWRYLEGAGVEIDSVTLTTKEGSTSMQSSLSRPDKGWPKGKYEVTMQIQADNKPLMKKPFAVE